MRKNRACPRLSFRDANIYAVTLDDTVVECRQVSRGVNELRANGVRGITRRARAISHMIFMDRNKFLRARNFYVRNRFYYAWDFTSRIQNLIQFFFTMNCHPSEDKNNSREYEIYKKKIFSL